MKIIAFQGICLVLCSLLIIRTSGSTVPELNREPVSVNTAEKTGYLTSSEKEVILEINRLRSDPRRYANEVISPLLRFYRNNLFSYPGDKPLMTKEGVSALKECCMALVRQKPLPLLNPSSGLTRAATDHVKDQSKSGKTGHTGYDNSTMRNRIERYGTWKYRIAENIGYGAINARQLVVFLLIDDGIASRGHRKNFLNPEFTMIGVAEGNHPDYESMYVMDFAAVFQDNSSR